MEDVYDLGALVEPLCSWYRKNKRSMPWRDEPTPYHVWLSEIMLQQTRISAAKAYYERFTKRLPDVESLAGVPEEELMKLWEGLGYYNRARNLQRAAKVIVERYDGRLPADYDLLMKLPGIGSYTAGAVASIAYGIPAPAVDGNVLRVAMRWLDCRDDITKPAVRKKMERSVVAVIPTERPGEFNQGLMELGEVVCIPNGAPLCGRCPLAGTCRGRAAGEETELPVKPAKKERRVEKRTVIVPVRGERFGIRKRPGKGLLAGLWEFPSADGALDKEQAAEYLRRNHIPVVSVEKLGDGKHIFSHVEWHMTGYRATWEDAETGGSAGLVWADREELLTRYALPAAFRPFLSQIL